MRRVMNRILVTGFDAFGSLAGNPSLDLIAKLCITDNELESAVIPTSYKRAIQDVIRLIEENRPQLCVMFGYSPRPFALKLERYGRNRDTAATADNDDVVLNGPIIEYGPSLIQSPIALDEIYASLRQSGHDVMLSDDAGGFVCNHTYYSVLKYLKETSVKCDALFVHIPGPELQSATIQAAEKLIQLLKLTKI